MTTTKKTNAEKKNEEMRKKVQKLEAAFSVKKEKEKNLSIKEQIDLKQKVLDIAAENLKKHFIGIDHIIDNIINDIKVWYIMPNILKRPVVVCLWGMTGVGKTDLVRRLVKELNFADRYVEIQMSHDGPVSKNENSLRDILTVGTIEPNEQSILLIDEIQKFRTLDEEGREKTVSSGFDDIWTLLSDGKFENSVNKDEIYELVIGSSYKWGHVYDFEDSKEQKKTENKLFQQFSKRMGLQQARRIKRVLKLPDSVEKIMEFEQEKIIELALVGAESKTVFEPLDYTKLLIFISGNLDEAYHMAISGVGDSDTDPDIYHHASANISQEIIKKSLSTRFRAEQIARFGNNHIIYPCLSKESFKQLISKKLSEVEIESTESIGINVSFDSSIHDFIFRNGVTPVQGVRPTLSAINQYIENSISDAAFFALSNFVDKVHISYDSSSLIFSITVDNEIKQTKLKLVGEFDKSRQLLDKNNKMLYSVHEAGHAIVYAVLFGLAPKQIVVDLCTNKGALTRIHGALNHKNHIPKLVTMLLAGRAAEQMVFGDGFISDGSSSDIFTATNYLASAEKEWGFGDKLIYHENESQEDAHSKVYTNDMSKELKKIPKLMKQFQGKATEILKENSLFFAEITKELNMKGRMSPEDFAEIANKHLEQKVIVVEHSHKIVPDYLKAGEDFIINEFSLMNFAGYNTALNDL